MPPYHSPVSIGLVGVYVAVLVLGGFPVAWFSYLRRSHPQPLLARFQAFTLVSSLVVFSDLVVRYLGPGLNVVRPEQIRKLNMLNGLILVPALIALSWVFIQLVFSLLQKRIPRRLTVLYFVAWGLFFAGFIVAEVRFFQTGSLTWTHVLEPVFGGGLLVSFNGPLLLLVFQSRGVADRGRRTLARIAALAYFAGFMLIHVGRAFGDGPPVRRLILQYLLPLICNASVAVYAGWSFSRRGIPSWSERQQNTRTEIFTRFRITPREQDVVLGILDGKSNAQIAESLFISEKTVETHVYNVYQKAGVKSRIRLLNLFQERP